MVLLPKVFKYILLGGWYDMFLSTPFVWVDLDIMENNIVEMMVGLKNMV